MKKKNKEIINVNLEENIDIQESQQDDNLNIDKNMNDNIEVQSNDLTINNELQTNTNNLEDSSNNNQPNININNIKMPEKPVKSKQEQKEFEAKLLINYIGKNYKKIIQEKFSFPAFFFGGLYLVYRKMYLLGIISYFLPMFLTILFMDNLIILSIVMILWLVMLIILGLFTNKKYAEKAYDECMNIDEKYGYISDEAIVKLCTKKGGTSIAGVIATIIFIGSIATSSAFVVRTIFGMNFGTPTIDNEQQEVNNIQQISPTTTQIETNKEESNTSGTISVLEQSKRSAATDSAHAYIKQIDNYIAMSAALGSSYYDPNNIPVDGATCTITNKTTYNNECFELLNSITIEGSTPTSGSFKLVDNRISYAKLVFSGYTIEYDGDNFNIITE